MKYQFFLDRRYLMIATAVFLVFSAYANQQLLLESLQQDPPKDSALLKLQRYLDSNYHIIDSYYKVAAEKQMLENEKKTGTRRLLQINDSLNVLLKADLCKICTQRPRPGAKDWRTQLKTLYESVIRLEKEEEELKTKLTDKTTASSLQSLDSRAKLEQEKFDEISGRLKQMSAKLAGPGTLNIPLNDKVAMYRFFIVSKTQHVVQVHCSMEGPASIETLLKSLSKTTEPLMITNGGMFRPGYGPQGLLIQNARILHSLDTSRPYKSNLNFYLLPNAVFYMEPTGNFKIQETKDFQKAYPAGAKNIPLFATQSGPLLFNGDGINSNFRMGSTNTNIRSGVGILDSGRVVFIISDNPVNFYDFALVFKEVFKCSSALYLDGAISEMYISEKLLANSKAVINGNFGPLISVTQKKKL